MALSIQPGRFGHSGKPDDAWLAKQEKEPILEPELGNHGMSVVDDQLRVHGLEALRTIDASVMPAVSSTNTNAPTIMIAEKGAAMIKANAREKLAA